MGPKDADRNANSVDPDQTAPLGAVWSGSALFAQAYLSKNLGSLRQTSRFCHVSVCKNEMKSTFQSYCPSPCGNSTPLISLTNEK